VVEVSQIDAVRIRERPSGKFDRRRFSGAPNGRRVHGDDSLPRGVVIAAASHGIALRIPNRERGKSVVGHRPPRRLEHDGLGGEGRNRAICRDRAILGTRVSQLTQRL
jgi:hypothetical protein